MKVLPVAPGRGWETGEMGGSGVRLSTGLHGKKGPWVRTALFQSILHQQVLHILVSTAVLT